MKIKPIRTEKIVGRQKIEDILDKCINKIDEGSVLAVTSKIVSICEGNVVDAETVNKTKLIRNEAELFLSADNRFGIAITIKDHILIPMAGIDESNGNGKLILWPKNPQKSADLIRAYLLRRFNVKNVGVIITDSKTTPLRWGTSGIAIAYSGFEALNDYIGNKDLFGRELMATKASIADGLAASAVLVMGEGSEQTPLALITEVPFVKFRKNNPTQKELLELRIDIKNDLYGTILNSVKWKKKK